MNYVKEELCFYFHIIVFILKDQILIELSMIVKVSLGSLSSLSIPFNYEIKRRLLFLNNFQKLHIKQSHAFMHEITEGRDKHNHLPRKTYMMYF